MGLDGLTASFPHFCCYFQLGTHQIKLNMFPKSVTQGAPLILRLQLTHANTLQSVLLVGLYMHTTNGKVIKKCEKAWLFLRLKRRFPLQFLKCLICSMSSPTQILKH